MRAVILAALPSILIYCCECYPGAQRTGSQNPEMTKRFSLARAQRIYHNLGFQEPRVTSKSACAAQPEHRVEPLAGGTGPDL